MGSGIHKLSALKVQKLNQPGYYGDGAGLWLQVTKSGGRSWVFRFRFCSKNREMGLGPLHTVSLAQARDKALLCRQILLDGKDPIEERKYQQLQTYSASAQKKTFIECAQSYIAAHQSGWKNPKHAKQWTSTLQTYAFPVIGDLPVELVDTSLLLQVLEPIWHTKTETATRIRNRIELVLDWAAAHNYRSGENPARWKGHMDKLLPARSKLQKVEHFSALDYRDAPQFMKQLQKREGISARAVEFTILTVARSGEVRGALWHEINFEERLWIIPAQRMKMNKEHRVPLSVQTLELLNQLPRLANCDLIFPGAKLGKSLSDMSLTAVLKRMGYGHITMHGFRSTFRDWAGEVTHYPREVIEHALAHKLADEVEAAYQRGDLLDKRRALMMDWSSYCYSQI